MLIDYQKVAGTKTWPPKQKPSEFKMLIEFARFFCKVRLPFILLFDACFESLRQDTTRSTGTASISSESTNRFLARFSARAVPVGVSVSTERVFSVNSLGKQLFVKGIISKKG
ncbi:hypothetical protein ERJ70_04090 [Sediminibacillus dalangtanensis]|uniref:Transposase n=1 Tax=Sediminibacillus dalangtanensis TaxID=2729421 RepID=A0ABX7VSV3_9BACI|nr:hypothetical protein [Sediminibacillus dalangtanensis]QTM98548.1 hypothetical protein ERJ70_04090 [Sediminibacillus dalangtanensis]